MKKLLLVLAFCGVFGIVLANNAIGRVCFFGDKECTTGKIVSHSDIYKAPCKYEDIFACKNANKHSICDEGKDKCYYPMGCDVGYYKTSDKICDIAAYSSLHNRDNNGCSLPITIGGRDCGSIGYGAVYDEFGFSKQTLVFNADSEKIDCYAAISKENCQKASPHGVCKQDECGNWHVTKCAEGYGFYWRNDSGCELGVDFNAEDGDAVCQKCLGCDYDTLEKCEEENPRSVCEAAVSDKVENCYNAVKCKEGYFKDEDRNEICEIGTYEKIYYKDTNGCGAPSISTFAPYSNYLWEPIEVSMYSVGIRAFLGENLANYYDEIDPYDYLAMETEYGAFGSKAKCEEFFKTACVSDMCGFWIRQGEKCEGRYASKEKCEEENPRSVCEQDEDECFNAAGCKRGYFKEEQRKEICSIKVNGIPATYTMIHHKDKNGCGAPGDAGCGSATTEYCEFGDPCMKGAVPVIPLSGQIDDDPSNWNYNMLTNACYSYSWYAHVSQIDCELKTEAGQKYCKQDKCGYWIRSHSVCNEGYVEYDEECPKGMVKDFEEKRKRGYDGINCYKCVAQCDYDTLEACHRENPNSVCEEGYEGATNCFNVEECLPGFYKESETEKACEWAAFQYLMHTDKNGCGIIASKNGDYFKEHEYKGKEGFIEIWRSNGSTMSAELVRELEYVQKAKAWVFTSKETCETSTIYGDFYCKPDMCGNWVHDYTKCRKGFARSDEECPNDMVLNKDIEKTMEDRSKCYECVSKCDKEVEEICKWNTSAYATVWASKYPNSYCENENGCKVIKCKNGYDKECPEGMTFNENVKIDNNGCGKCIEKCTHTSMAECERDNFNSVCKKYGENCYGGNICKEGAGYRMGYGMDPSTKDLNGCTRRCNSGSYNTLSWCEGVYRSATCGDDGNTCYAPIGCKYKTKDACEQRYSRSYCEQEFKYGENCYLPKNCKPGFYKTCPDGWAVNISTDGNGCHGCKKIR